MATETPRSLDLAPIAADPTAIPDPDRAHPAGLTWVEPLTPRPIALGPSADHPDVRPVLALDAGRFWTAARHGLAVGRARREMDTAAVRYALSASLSRAPHLAVAMAEAAGVWTDATTHAATDLFGATA
jgi:hypothetical protein